MNKVNALLKAGSLPDGTIVRKPQGEKKYTLKQSIRIFPFDKHFPRETIEKTHSVLLLSTNGDINLYPREKLLKVEMSIDNDELAHMLNVQEDLTDNLDGDGLDELEYNIEVEYFAISPQTYGPFASQETVKQLFVNLASRPDVRSVKILPA